MLDLELRHLRYFITVAEELSFTRAAERLQMAQPPLSRQIQQLEKALGAELLHRTQRRVELTAAGKVFLDECRQTLAQLEASILKTRRVARGEVGRLDIAFEGSFNYEIVPRAVKEFQVQFPDVEIVLREMSTGDQVQALRDKQIDLGFLVPPIPDEGFAIAVVLSEPLVVALAETHPLAALDPLELAQLANEPWITGPSERQCGLLTKILNACHQAGFTPQVRQQTNEIQMALGFVAAGLGVTLLPASIRRFNQAGIIYRSLKPPAPEAMLAMAWQDTASSPVLKAFLQTIQCGQRSDAAGTNSGLA